jgi:hypothetical protein
MAWDTEKWIFDVDGSSDVSHSFDDVATPNLATTWTVPLTITLLPIVGSFIGELLRDTTNDAWYLWNGTRWDLLTAQQTITGPWSDDYDAENAGVELSEIYKADGGTIAWRDSSFSIASLSPLFHWSAAVSGSSLDAGSSQASDAEAVSVLVDSGSEAKNASLSGNAATYEASGPNGMPWLKTAASSPGQYVTAAFGQFPAKRGTWWIVYRPEALVGNKRIQDFASARRIKPVDNAVLSIVA